MSQRRAQAMIHWVPVEAGGRRTVPESGIYSTVARFEDDENWPRAAWSLVVHINRPFRDGRYAHAAVQMLSDEAPPHLLATGSRFELLEGARRVAKGVVLPTAVRVPDEVDDFDLALLG